MQESQEDRQTWVKHAMSHLQRIETDREYNRRLVHEHVEKELPKQKSASYLRACDVAPALVEEESDPYRFYQLESGNIERAAGRLAHYWELRVQFFGVTRAFRPIRDLSGNGALQEKDICSLQTGWLTVQPIDEGSKWIYFYDRTLENDPEVGDSLSRCRIIFYMLSLAPPTASVALLRLTDTPRWEKANAIRGCETMLSVPIDFSRHVSIFRPPPGARRLFQETLEPAIKEFAREYMPGKMEVVVESAKGDLVHQLGKCGLSPADLPVELGGTWKKASFLKFLEGKIQADRDIARPGTSNVDELFAKSVGSADSKEQLVARGMSLDESTKDKLRERVQSAQLIPLPIRNEIDPLLFLCVADGNTWLADQQMSRYWKTRCCLFHALAEKPMHLTGEGALPVETVERLQDRAIVFLPLSRGRQVLYLGGKVDVRCAFYMLSVACRIRKPLIILMNHVDNLPEVVDILNVLPVLLETVVVFGQSCFPDSVEFTVQVVIDDLPGARRQALGQLGLVREGLPAALGGVWSLDRFDSWMAHRRIVELWLTGKIAALQGPSSHLSLSEASHGKQAPIDAKVLQRRKDRKREWDARYARERRKRLKDKEDTVTKRYSRLRAVNNDLRVEEKRLSALLQRAKDVVAEWEQN